MKRISFLFCCCLLSLSYFSCHQCEPAGQYYGLQNDFIPYEEGSAFQMHDSAGRIVHFVDTIYQNGNVGGWKACDCCDPSSAAIVRTAFRSDSVHFFLVFQEAATATEDNRKDDGFIVDVDGSSFYGQCDGDALLSSGSTTVTTIPSMTVGGQSYQNVFEMNNGLSLPSVQANKVWYHKTGGLLKIQFTDGSTLEL